MQLDPATWPAIGRIGRCREGEAAGSLMFLHLATEDRDPRTAHWQAFFRPPIPGTNEDEFFVNHSSGVMQDLVALADMDWIPEGTDGPYEDKELGLRRRFAHYGSPDYADFIEELDRVER